MESEHFDTNENSTTSGNTTARLGDPSSTDCNTNPDLSYANRPGEILRNVENIVYIYREDIVRSKANNKIGLVTEVAGDSDSDSSSTDGEDEEEDEKDIEADPVEEGDAENEGDGDVENDGNGDENDSPLKIDQVRVLWIDESETTENIEDVTVVDRGFFYGDYVADVSNPTGQIGIVVDVDIKVDLLTHTGTVLEDKPTRELKRIRDFSVGDHVVLGPWLGRIEDVLDNVTVMFDDGSVCKVLKAEPLRLKPVDKSILEEAHFPYYPGQRVKASSSSVFKNSRWLSGVWKANRLEGTVIKVTVGSVYIYWIASAGYGPESSTTPSEEQGPNNLKSLSCFAHNSWRLGDWCLLPSTSESSSLPLNKELMESQDSCKGELEPTETGDESDAEIGTAEQSTDGNKLMEDNVEASFNKSKEKSVSTSSCSLVSASKEAFHEKRSLHLKYFRKRKDKRIQKKLENYERALLIINAKTKVDVAWQDGTIKRGMDSTSLIRIDTPGDHEFVAEQYVVEKAVDDDSDEGVETRLVGIVKSVSAKDRTACIRWLKPVERADDPREFGKEEIVSVYELEAHPDYDYCYGDVVVRLSPVFVPEKMESSLRLSENTTLSSPNEHMSDGKMQGESENLETDTAENMSDFSDLSWVGNITGLKDGDIEVTWADGMISTVGPQAIYVVGRDDDDSVAAGSDDVASWETFEDDDTETRDIAIASEEHEVENAIDVRCDHKDRVVADNSGRSGALSLPFAAIGYMTRMASGIFSRGRNNSDSVDSETKSDDDLQSKELNLSRDPDSESKEPSDMNYQHAKPTTEYNGEKDESTEDSSLSEIAETLCNLKFQDSVVPPKYDELITSFKGFDIVRDPIDHHFIGSEGQNNASRKWLKKVQQDWNILQSNLPDGIYVRAYEDRMDLLRAAIVGAYGTPYQDGLFFFDFHLPPEYPDVPPTASYHSGGWRINPNLYEDGKVCLSLLNTWTGRGNEVWDPKTSSILQVLVSLQGLVLNSKPYFNEAGYDKQVGTAEGEKNSLSYNENTFLLNCKTMMFLMRRRPKGFEELIVQHFKKRGNYILKACDAYMKGHLIGSLKTDASSSHVDSDSNSVGFKLMLTKIVPKLFAALDEVEADCQEFKHLVQS